MYVDVHIAQSRLLEDLRQGRTTRRVDDIGVGDRRVAHPLPIGMSPTSEDARLAPLADGAALVAPDLTLKFCSNSFDNRPGAMHDYEPSGLDPAGPIVRESRTQMKQDPLGLVRFLPLGFMPINEGLNLRCHSFQPFVL
jgi:hypothetical protein